MPSVLLVLKWKASREVGFLGFLGTWFSEKILNLFIFYYFTILLFEITIEVSYAAFAKNFCSYDVLVDGFVVNKVAVIFISKGL